MPENYTYQHSLHSRHGQSEAESSRTTFNSTPWNPSPYRPHTKKPQALTLKILETPTDLTQTIHHTKPLKTYA